MTRKKVKLSYIVNDSARKATFKKRKKGLMKKVSELSILCDVQACAIVYSPYDSQPEVWPSPMGVHSVLSEFKNMPEMDQTKKMMNQESFLRQRITKTNDQLRKIMRDNRERDVQQVMFQSLIAGNAPESMTVVDFYDIQWVIDHHLREVCKKLGENPDEQTPAGSDALVADATGSPSATMFMPMAGPLGVDVTAPQEIVIENLQQQKQQWLMEMMNQQENNGALGGNGPFGDHNDNNTMSLWTSSYYP